MARAHAATTSPSRRDGPPQSVVNADQFIPVECGPSEPHTSHTFRQPSRRRSHPAPPPRGSSTDRIDSAPSGRPDEAVQRSWVATASVARLKVRLRADSLPEVGNRRAFFRSAPGLTLKPGYPLLIPDSRPRDVAPPVLPSARTPRSRAAVAAISGAAPSTSGCRRPRVGLRGRSGAARLASPSAPTVADRQPPQRANSRRRAMAGVDWSWASFASECRRSQDRLASARQPGDFPSPVERERLTAVGCAEKGGVQSCHHSRRASRSSRQ